MIRGLLERLGLAEGDTTSLTDLRSPKTQMALALGRVKRPDQVYGGSVSPAVVQRHRAANKVARASRRINRRGSK